MKNAIALLLCMASFGALAEGRCPPGQYPVGDQNAGGCAPIPGAGEPAASKPTGKWETRWGAIAEDPSNMSTGAAVSQKSKRAASSVAMEECERVGGKACKVRITYYNQCVAMADPTLEFRRSQPAGTLTQTMASAAETVELAKNDAMKQCQSYGSGQPCSIVYSACSMSEFKEF